MKAFRITREMMETARSYMPLGVKKELAENIAELCLKDIDIAPQNKIGEKTLAYPRLKGENALLREILLLNTLLGFYFDIEVDEKEDPYESYDRYNEENILSQINRWKTDVELKEKCYDLLDDFKKFEKIVNTEIRNRREAENDILARFTAAITVYSDPETIKKAMSEIERLGEEISKIKSQKEEK
ncbi:MAG: hypothetical protein KBS59_04065 [Clostridiales bacterium]|nr:hypothetical protein [Clostridiales bacterium]